MVFKVDCKLFHKEFNELVNSGKSESEALAILIAKYGENEKAEKLSV